MMINKEKCNCGKIAVWLQMSSSRLYNPFYCDDCVPRGCTCNRYNIEEFPEIVNEYNINKRPYKIVDSYLVPIDEQKREYPCVEFDYDKDGFDIEN